MVASLALPGCLASEAGISSLQDQILSDVVTDENSYVMDYKTLQFSSLFSTTDKVAVGISFSASAPHSSD